MSRPRSAEHDRVSEEMLALLSEQVRLLSKLVEGRGIGVAGRSSAVEIPVPAGHHYVAVDTGSGRTASGAGASEAAKALGEGIPADQIHITRVGGPPVIRVRPRR